MERSKCDELDQTLDKIIEYVSEKDVNMSGWAVYITKHGDIIDKSIIKNLTYPDTKNLTDKVDNIIGFKFFPFGYSKSLDDDIINNNTGLKIRDYKDI